MLVDAYTKAILTVIAVALVLIVAQPIYAPATARAEGLPDLYVRQLQSDVSWILSSLNSIAYGTCINAKLC